ncbi:MAG: alpha/beta fold hydrolase [Acidothermaceae bacterium]
MTVSFKVKLGEATLACERWGDGPPAAVLLHCGICDRRGWSDVAQLLAPRLPSLVTYDGRGFGESSDVAGNFSHVGDLIGLLDRIGGSQPVWLVGSSMGGGLALDTAVVAPERVAGLVLFAPSISGSAEPESYDPNTERLAALIDSALDADDLDAAVRWQTWLWLDGPGMAEGRVGGPARALAQTMTRDALSRRNGENAGASGVDAWSRLGDIAVSTTVVCGDLDLPFIVERSHELADRVPGAAYRELAGVAHLPYLEDAPMVANVIATAIG